MSTEQIIAGIVNVAGGSGKSTCDWQWVSKKLNAKRIAVEEINGGVGHYDLSVSAAEFEDAVAALRKNRKDNIVIDIGASTAGAGMKDILASYPRLLGNIDWWFVPVTAKEHSIDGARKTVVILRELGVPKEKILVIPNDVQPSKVPGKPLKWREDFASVYEMRERGVFVPDTPLFHHAIVAQWQKKEYNHGFELTDSVYSIAATYDQVEQELFAAQDAGDEALEHAKARRLVACEACEAVIKNFDRTWDELPIAEALQAPAQPAAV